MVRQLTGSEEPLTRAGGYFDLAPEENRIIRSDGLGCNGPGKSPVRAFFLIDHRIVLGMVRLNLDTW